MKAKHFIFSQAADTVYAECILIYIYELMYLYIYSMYKCIYMYVFL